MTPPADSHINGWEVMARSIWKHRGMGVMEWQNESCPMFLVGHDPLFFPFYTYTFFWCIQIEGSVVIWLYHKFNYWCVKRKCVGKKEIRIFLFLNSLLPVRKCDMKCIINDIIKYMIIKYNIFTYDTHRVWYTWYGW